MITRMAQHTATRFAKKNFYSSTEVNVYQYGFELLFSTILNALGLFAISLIIGTPIHMLLFVAAFIPLRLTAGGYHAKHHWSCFLSMNITYLCFAMLLHCIPNAWLQPYIFSTLIISVILIVLLAPVDAINKPLSDKKKLRLRKQSITIISSYMAVVVVLGFLQQPAGLYGAYFASGYFAASISLAAAVLSKER